MPSYKVNLRIGLEGHAPVSLNTILRSGQKSYISEISDDGQSEILVEMLSETSMAKNRDGLKIEMTVTKRVRGVQKVSEHTQIFVPENQEFEMNIGKGKRSSKSLSLAVVAHKL